MGEWREEVVDGKVVYREGWGDAARTSACHPLTPMHARVVHQERQRRRPRMRYPPWLHWVSESVVSFVDEGGESYAYDFAHKRLVGRGTGAAAAMVQLAIQGDLDGTPRGEPDGRGSPSPVLGAPNLEAIASTANQEVA